jgi:hypothetical protein
MNIKTSTVGAFITGFILIAYASVWLPTRTNGAATTKILKDNHYTHIQLKGYGWFQCAQDDWSHTKFEATNPYGVSIQGVVCCGLLFKNCTVRYK